MSLVVVATLAAASLVAAAGAALAAARVRKAQPSAGKSPSVSTQPPFDDLQLQVGDVVLRGNHEVWLTSALAFFEGPDCVAALFLGSENVGSLTQAILVQPGPPRLVAWVEQLEIESLSILPDAIEIAGEHLTRKSRIPVQITRHGDCGQKVAASGLWSLYEAPSARIAVSLCCESSSWSWTGEWIPEGAILRLAAGSATLRKD